MNTTFISTASALVALVAALGRAPGAQVAQVVHVSPKADRFSLNQIFGQLPAQQKAANRSCSMWDKSDQWLHGICWVFFVG